jgi:hypothetical protein
MMQNAVTIHKVPAIEGSHNYLAWKAPCISVLKANNVWKFLDGPPPLAPTRDPDEKE